MILIISSIFPPEPVVSASISYDLAVTLSENWEVTVLRPKPTRPKGYSFDENQINNHTFNNIILNSYTHPKSKIIGRMVESYSFGKHAVDFIKKNQSEIKCIYLHSWPLLSQFLIVKASKRYSIPIILRVVDIYPESLFDKLPLFKRLVIRLLLQIDRYVQKSSNKVITLSPKMKSYLITSRRLNSNKVDVIYNWQNEDNFISFKNLKKEKEKDTAFTFMFLGNLNRTAGVEVLISSFGRSDLTNSRLVIAGNGSERESLISCAHNFKGLNIEFWDAPLIKVPEIQDKADVLLLSLRKGAAKFALPSKLPAYMLSAKPIIACVDADSDVASTIVQAECGWVVPSENIDALSKIMRTVVTISGNDLQKAGRNGFSYAIENFSKKKNLQKLSYIINETLRK